VSASAPTVELLSPNGGEQWRQNSRATIRWRGTDSDGDNLTYALWISNDGGEDWQPLAIDISDTSVTVDTAGFPVSQDFRIKVRVTDLLCKVETEEQVLEYCAAFTQLYREEAHYLERTAPWVERVGLAHIKSKVVEDEANRKILAERFMVSQKPAQIDPWKERTEGELTREFTPIAVLA
jgi:hypothetical protein